MSQTREFIIRTEDIRPEEVLSFYVRTERDDQLVAMLKGPTPLVIEGSRGTGKSLLLRVCEQEQLSSLSEEGVLPVYVSFVKSSLLHTNDPLQFQHWMLARLSSRILRTLYSIGLLGRGLGAARVLAGDGDGSAGEPTRLEKVVQDFENSFKNPGTQIDTSAIPDVEDFRDSIQDLCAELGLRRINILFDEAAHIFRPEQQRQFFTLFRDLRSPYMTCNAAVYPGVTAYGATFEAAHDARIESLHREVTDPGYRDQMREIIYRQADSDLQKDIERNGENFDALAFAVSGNPRLLLKTVALAPKLRSGEVQSAIKEFYRSNIWSEHSGLAERYAGHRALIDWGRKFVEETIVNDAIRKNESWKADGKSERTCFFWVHRDAPEAVKEALRLLTYTGVVSKLDSGVVATRREIGTRYSINIGCLASPSSNPITFISDLRKGLSIKRFTEYGANYSVFGELVAEVGSTVEADTSQIINQLLQRSVEVLDLTRHQKDALISIGIDNIGKTLASNESVFQKAHYIGPKRSRKIMNVATSAVLEYLSG
ncbi:hypothetical protein A7E78_04020 [Syntrophotalea acetylenivorans]|uniref:Orc1-like AAA ATPase domain-containing protein n=1 Tax=Syntrophotalea acetylenivorans TaxID=1842532 RepID=A0A1L3GMB4_9BACT|nr:hypothetical protein [Syntrophotalea acetylenivorans]APG27073.1 hypothetical protein A7E78_04020 [Syntrophotalea acetylenivorans]